MVADFADLSNSLVNYWRQSKQKGSVYIIASLSLPELELSLIRSKRQTFKPSLMEPCLLGPGNLRSGPAQEFATKIRDSGMDSRFHV